VIVVDGGSKDGTISFIKENYPQVVLIENIENIGAAEARNQGIKIAKSEWILTLDCDIHLEKDFLCKMTSFIKKLDINIGSFQPKILNFDKKTIYSTGIYLSRIRRFFDIGKGQSDNGNFNRLRFIFGACSAAAFYKREMLEQINEKSGYFDKRFFFLIEDVDLSWRAQRKGWKALYYPEAHCYHSGDSSNTSQKIRQYLCFRNRYYTIIKNDSFKNMLINCFLSFPYDAFRFFHLLFSNPYTLKAFREIFQFLINETEYYSSGK